MINKDDIQIRTLLLPGDLGYVAYLHGWIYSKECGYGLNFERYVLEGLGEFSRQYIPLRDRVWICEYNEKIVGFLAGVNRGDSVQLRYFIVVPEFRSFGLGKRLMALFMEYLKELNIQHAYLWTTNEQAVASSLYTRHGFRLTEEKASTVIDKPLIEQRYDWRREN